MNTQSDTNKAPTQNAPSSWPELIWRVRYIIILFSIFILACVTGIIISYRSTVIDLLTNNLQALKEVQKLHSNPIDNIMFY